MARPTVMPNITTKYASLPMPTHGHLPRAVGEPRQESYILGKLRS